MNMRLVEEITKKQLRKDIPDFKPGDAVSVTLKDSFTEETPFYYPIVYEIKLIDQ